MNCQKGRGQEIDNRPLPPAPSRKGRGRTSQSLLYVFLAIPILYLVAIVAALYAPLIAEAIFVVAALIWLIPDRRIEKVLPRTEG